jgi:hypothetical protein
MDGLQGSVFTKCRNVNEYSLDALPTTQNHRDTLRTKSHTGRTTNKQRWGLRDDNHRTQKNPAASPGQGKRSPCVRLYS